MAIHKIKSHIIISEKDIDNVKNPIALAIWINIQFLDNDQSLDENEIISRYSLDRSQFLEAVGELSCLGLIDSVGEAL